MHPVTSRPPKTFRRDLRHSQPLTNLAPAYAKSNFVSNLTPPATPSRIQLPQRRSETPAACSPYRFAIAIGPESNADDGHELESLRRPLADCDRSFLCSSAQASEEFLIFDVQQRAVNWIAVYFCQRQIGRKRPSHRGRGKACKSVDPLIQQNFVAS